MSNGKFVVSLDFELMWGMKDREPDEALKKRVLNGREAVLELLELFNKYKIHATWAVVGFMLADSKEQLLAIKDKGFPKYTNKHLNNYEYLDSIGANESNDSLHFGRSLIEKIHRTPNQEIASHSFSHYYMNEDGQSIHDFEDDIIRFDVMLNQTLKIKAKTYIHPRCQIDQNYHEVLKKHGYTAYRGNKTPWYFNNRIPKVLNKIGRFLDRYTFIFGYRTYNLYEVEKQSLLNVKESYYMHPYKKGQPIREWLKIRRIKKQMKHAAKKGEIFHLWWHPHDLGAHFDKNLYQIRTIIYYQDALHKKYNYQSQSINYIASVISK